jgi:hypothetical protein
VRRVWVAAGVRQVHARSGGKRCTHRCPAAGHTYHTHTHTRTRTHTHTHTHTQSRAPRVTSPAGSCRRPLTPGSPCIPCPTCGA